MRKISLLRPLVSLPLTSLGLALTLSGCGPKQDSTASAPVTVPAGSAENTAATPATTSAAQNTAALAAAPNSRLNVSVSEGTLTVSLNGRKVGDYPSSIQLDVTPYLKPGKNTLKLDWSAKTRGTVKIQYALAAAPEKYNDISSFNLFSPEGNPAGSKSLEFNLPNPDGTLAPEEPAVADASTPQVPPRASAGGVPVPDVTIPPSPLGASSDASPQTEAPASAVKAIMSVSANDAPIAVSLNGQSVGNFQSYLKLDVGRYLKPGTNTMQVKWTRKTYFDVKIAYFSSDANDYRDISRTRLYNSDTVKPGSRTISFQIPTS